MLAIDLAQPMLAVGERNVAAAGLAERIRLQLVDAKRMPYAAHSFAALISNSILHHIPAPAAVVAEMVRVVRPDGLLFVRDLLRPEDDAAVRRLVAQYAGGANAHQQQMFEDSLRAALTLEEARGLATPHGFAPESVKATSDRHWTWAARRP